ncbi:glycosyltransferase [bacterium]|nr:glycosyltransferase [bacterium]
MSVTVITSVLNSSEFLDQFIENMEAQTIFDDCEFMFLDADSDDDSRDKILKAVQKHKNVQYWNVGRKKIYPTWNIGVKLAKTPYITNWNTDDRRTPHSLEVQRDCLADNEDVDLCYGITLWTTEPNKNLSETHTTDQFPCLEPSLESLLQVNSPHCMPMWTKRLHEKYGLFNEDFFSAGDYELWLRAMKNGSKFMKINNVVGSYYRNPTGISSNPETIDRAVEEVLQIKQFYNQ